MQLAVKAAGAGNAFTCHLNVQFVTEPSEGQAQLRTIEISLLPVPKNRHILRIKYIFRGKIEFSTSFLNTHQFF